MHLKPFFAKLKEHRTILEVAVATLLFLYASFSGNIVNTIIYILYFIIFLELTNLVFDFITYMQIKIKIVLNTFIIIILRELIVVISKLGKVEISSVEMLWQTPSVYHIIIYTIAVLVLFFIKYISIITSEFSLKQYFERDKEIKLRQLKQKRRPREHFDNQPTKKLQGSSAQEKQEKPTSSSKPKA